MHNVLQSTRRAFLAKAPIAAAAIATPAIAIAASETPHDKVRRLSKELSRALAEHEGGDYHAKVFAANQPYAGFQLVLDNLRETPEERAQRMAMMFQFAMMKLKPLPGNGVIHDLNYEGGSGTGPRVRLSIDAHKGEDILIGFLPRLPGPVHEPREV